MDKTVNQDEYSLKEKRKEEKKYDRKNRTDVNKMKRACNAFLF